MRKPADALYRDQRAWRDLQEYLPERLRLTDETAPAEEFWEWRGHRVHLDRYINPDAPAKIVQHHGVGTNGRQMSLIVGAPLAQRGFANVMLVGSAGSLAFFWRFVALVADGSGQRQSVVLSSLRGAWCRLYEDKPVD